MERADFTLEAADGTRLFAAHAPTAHSRKRHVLIFHGYGEHLGRYHEVMGWFAEAGIHAWAVDFRGHGRSAGHRAYVEQYDHYLQDAHALISHVQSRFSGEDLYLLGHSQGGLIGLRALEEGMGPFKAAVLSAPAMGLALKANPVKVAAGKLMSRILPKLNLPPEIPNTFLCRDPDRVASYGADPLVNHCVNCRWFTEFLDAQEEGYAKVSQVTLPVLVLHPTGDRIISPDSVRKMYDGLGSPDKELLTLEGYYHEPLNEPEREDVFHQMLAWLDAR